MVHFYKKKSPERVTACAILQDIIATPHINSFKGQRDEKSAL